MITIHDVEQGSQGWHDKREGRYTGSNSHKLLRYGAIEYALTAASGFTGNFYTKRGHLLEDEAIQLYEKITSRNVARPGFITSSLFDNAGYSPDGLCPGDRVIECKAFNNKRHMAIYNGDIPFEILAQVHFGMLICEVAKADLVIYNPYFAKREIDGVTNRDYNPKYAIKIIPIKHNRNIANNFRRILNGGTATAKSL